MFNTTHKYCEYTFLTSIFRSERSEINMFEGVTIEKSNICTVIDGLKSSRKKCSLLVPNFFFFIYLACPNVSVLCEMNAIPYFASLLLPLTMTLEAIGQSIPSVYLWRIATFYTVCDAFRWKI